MHKKEAISRKEQTPKYIYIYMYIYIYIYIPPQIKISTIEN